MNASVLMSVYNETIEHIRESVLSVLSQVFVDFELIIILDNPERKDVKMFIEGIKDSRIVFVENERNIGLAMSMNRAAKLARSDIFVRMDADDIAEIDRFQKQLKLLESGQYDLVFSRYCFIDEESRILDGYKEEDYYNSDVLSRTVSVNPHIIHHPTVMFTREIFEKVGGYRDFPCSQDADLWLRMQEAGCRFVMLPDKLLRYRINPRSVSSKRWYQQQLTIHYIMNLSLERLQKGKDSYSIEGYNKYLSEKGCNNEKKAAALRDCEEILTKASKYRSKGNNLQSILLRIYVFLKSKQLRDYYLCVLKKKKLMR